MDKIIIDGIQVQAIIGVHPHERRKKQDIAISLTLFTDVRKAALTDDLRHTLDYEAIEKRVSLFAEASGYYLLEKLTSEIASVVLKEFPAVEKLIARIDKPSALPNPRQVSVELERSRADY